MVSSGGSAGMVENARATTEGGIKVAYSAYVIDNERVRLEGIDAAERTPHKKHGWDAIAYKNELARLRRNQ